MCDFTFKQSAPAFLAKDKNTVFYPGAGTHIHDITILRVTELVASSMLIIWRHLICQVPWKKVASRFFIVKD